MISYFDHEYDFGDIVYLKTDVEQKPRMVVRLSVGVAKITYYTLACGSSESDHHAIEITKEPIVF